jgi:hypothetical protein
MNKNEELSLEKAQKLVQKEENRRRNEFANKIQELSKEYGYTLTAKFTMFGTEVNPPIRVIKLGE